MKQNQNQEFPPFKIAETQREMPTLGSTIAQESIIILGNTTLNAFVKSGVTPMAIENVHNQAVSHEVVNAIGQAASPSFRAPTIYGFNPEGSLATEWINTEPLSELQDIKRTAVALGGILAAFDKWGERSISPPQFGLRDLHDDYINALRVRIAERLHLGHIREEDARLFHRAIQRLNSAYPLLCSVTQHGDLRPDHIYPDPTHKCDYVVIDSELMRGLWPRFYDLGKALARYTITHPNLSLGSATLRVFMDAVELEQQAVLEPLKCILTARGLTFSLFPIHDLRTVSQRIAADFRKRSIVLLENLPDIHDMDGLKNLLVATANRTAWESEIPPAVWPTCRYGYFDLLLGPQLFRESVAYNAA